MRRREKRDLKKQLNEIDVPTGLQRFDKMSLHFVLPLVLFYSVVGLLLILLNEMVTNVAAWALAAGMVLVGGWLLLRYLRAGLEKRLAGVDMALGLVLLLAGGLLICSPEDMKEVFPKIWGLSLIFGGFLKIQYAFDEKSVKVNKWWIMLIFAAVSLAIGILALLNRTVFGESQHLVIGIFLLAEAVLDLITYFLLSRGMKKQNSLNDDEEFDVPAKPEALEEPAGPLPEPEQGPESED